MNVRGMVAAVDWAVGWIERLDVAHPLASAEPVEPRADGTLPVPHWRLAPPAAAFVRGLYGCSLIIPFDWSH